MSTFVIILSFVLILALLIYYLTKDEIFDEEDLPYIEPLNNNFKPIIPDLYTEDDDTSPMSPPPPPIEPSFPLNPSEVYIESYYTALYKKEQPEIEDATQNTCTINMYVESHYELKLSMFGKGPTIEMIHEAYEKLLNEHVNSIANGEKPSFDIGTKQRAKEYLITHYASINNQKD